MSRSAAALRYRSGTESRGVAVGSNPLIARTLIIGLSAVTVLAMVVGQARLLRYGFPVGALAVGAVLYWYYHELYVGYVWWLWFLTPLVRRLVDFRSSYDPLSLVMLAPVAVTALCLLSLVRHLPKMQRKSLAAIFPVLLGVLLAYPVGVLNNGLAAATLSLLNYIVPMAFGFHLAIDGSRYLGYRRTTRRAFILGACALGLYGILQFISPMPWDRYWMLNTDMSTIGRPLPFEVRVFSTLNSPTPFAMVMLAGLLMLLETRAVVHLSAGLPAYLALLLSNVRTAMCGWILGVGLYATYLRPQARLRIFAMLGLFALGLILLIATPLGSGIERRFASFADLQEDKSLSVRAENSVVVAGMILNQPLGQGLGAVGTGKKLATSHTMSFDNGFLDLFFTLGWVGGFLYLGGTLVLLGTLLRRFETRNDPVPRVARAMAFATFAALSSLNTLIGVSGLTFWGWVGLSIGGSAWYRSTTALPRAAPPHSSAAVMATRGPRAPMGPTALGS